MQAAPYLLRRPCPGSCCDPCTVREQTAFTARQGSEAAGCTCLADLLDAAAACGLGLGFCGCLLLCLRRNQLICRPGRGRAAASGKHPGGPPVLSPNMVGSRASGFALLFSSSEQLIGQASAALRSPPHLGTCPASSRPAATRVRAWRRWRGCGPRRWARHRKSGGGGGSDGLLSRRAGVLPAISCAPRALTAGRELKGARLEQVDGA